MDPDRQMNSRFPDNIYSSSPFFKSFEDNFLDSHMNYLNELTNQFFSMSGLPRPETVIKYQNLQKASQSRKKVVDFDKLIINESLRENEVSDKEEDNNNFNSNLEGPQNTNDLIRGTSKSTQFYTIPKPGSHEDEVRITNQLQKLSFNQQVQTSDQQQKDASSQMQNEALQILDDQQNQSQAIWTPEETKLLYDLLQQYGKNIQQIQKHFPKKSKKQIKKKLHIERKLNPTKITELIYQNNKFVRRSKMSRCSFSNCSTNEITNESFIHNLDNNLCYQFDSDNDSIDEDFQARKRIKSSKDLFKLK